MAWSNEEKHNLYQELRDIKNLQMEILKESTKNKIEIKWLKRQLAYLWTSLAGTISVSAIIKYLI